jgi:hypothetical protein
MDVVLLSQMVGFTPNALDCFGFHNPPSATFIEATKTCDEGRRRELMDEILSYNQEDLAATWTVFRLQAKIPPPIGGCPPFSPRFSLNRSLRRRHPRRRVIQINKSNSSRKF